MAVKMRLTRMGDKKSPFYRVVVIGYVDPLKTPAEINIDVEKAKAWLAKGVQPTETVKSYLVKVGAMEQPKKLSAAKTNDKKKKKD